MPLYPFFAGVQSLYIFLLSYMRALGISLQNMAYIVAVSPMSGKLGTIVIGKQLSRIQISPQLVGTVLVIAADRTGQYKLVFILGTIVTCLSHTALLYVPTASPELPGNS